MAKKSEIWQFADLIAYMYTEREMTMEVISKGFDCSVNTIANILRESGVPKKRMSDETEKMLYENRHEIIDDYVEDKMHLRDIGLKFSVQSTRIRKLLVRNGIEIRKPGHQKDD